MADSNLGWEPNSVFRLVGQEVVSLGLRIGRIFTALTTKLLNGEETSIACASIMFCTLHACHVHGQTDMLCAQRSNGDSKRRVRYWLMSLFDYCSWIKIPYLLHVYLTGVIFSLVRLKCLDCIYIHGTESVICFLTSIPAFTILSSTYLREKHTVMKSQE